MTVVDCISDLHGHYPDLEGGDLLIVAGDLTKGDTGAEYIEFGIWLVNQRYRRKIVIPGNHDKRLQMSPEILKGDIDHLWTYLCDSGTEFEGLKIWGSPWTKWFHGVHPKCKAFMLHSEEELAKKFALIPNDIDILVTHVPPYFCRDEVALRDTAKKYNAGSYSLLCVHKRVKPRLHVFGHIHEGYGTSPLTRTTAYYPDNMEGEVEFEETPRLTQLVNCAHVNERYEPVNKPIRVIL